MSTPGFVDQQLGESLKCWHMAPGGRPGSVALTGRNFFADGDGVTVLIRVSGEEALASDGGVMATRLADAGVDLWGGTRASAAWTELLAGYHLREVDGRIVGRRPVAQAEMLASDIASAMLTADGLRWMAAPERESRMVQQVYDFLDLRRYSYSKRPTIKLPHGSTVRPTASIQTPDRPVLVQAVGGSEQSIEHALALVQRIARADYQFNQRLVLLPGEPEDWRPDNLELLTDHAPVGFMNRMDEVQAFLSTDTPIPKPALLGP